MEERHLGFRGVACYDIFDAVIRLAKALGGGIRAQ